jgi:hypothetical protein
MIGKLAPRPEPASVFEGIGSIGALILKITIEGCNVSDGFD